MDIGDMRVPFIYQGEELIYPEYVKDGLVLHYDFSGMTNNDASKDIARDLSGNGNHGTLQNFNFTPESGYDKNKLLFDGVDDYIASERELSIRTIEFSAIIREKKETYSTIASTYGGQGTGGFAIYNYGEYLRILSSTQEGNELFTKRGLIVGSKVNGAIVFDVSHCIIYINGTEFLKQAHGGFKPEQSGYYKGFWVGSYVGGTLYRSQDEFFSVKAYNRPLTPEEIAHNYAIEKERFNIE